MKTAMLKHSFLTYPDHNQPFVLYTDASDTRTGAILFQRDSSEHLRLIAYTSPTHEKVSTTTPPSPTAPSTSATPPTSLLTPALAQSDSWEDAYKEDSETFAQFYGPSMRDPSTHEDTTLLFLFALPNLLFQSTPKPNLVPTREMRKPSDKCPLG